MHVQHFLSDRCCGGVKRNDIPHTLVEKFWPRKKKYFSWIDRLIKWATK